MGPMLGRVMDIGRGAAQGTATVANRAWNIPGNAARMGVDALEDSTYKFLSRNAGDRAEAVAQRIYMSPDFPKVSSSMEGASEANKQIFNQLRDSTFDQMQTKARSQAALVPGGLRFAGRAAKSPLAMTAYGVGGTLAAGNMMEEQGQREQLMAMGLSPEEAEILSNELAMAAMNMEPTEYV